MLKKFSISIIKSLIVLVFLTFIFSIVSSDFENLVTDMFGDIYEYASPDAQTIVIMELAETCLSLEQGGNLVTFNELCNDRSVLDEMQKNCEDYRALKRRNIEIENEEQVREACDQIESGEIERICDEAEGSLIPDFSGMGTLCKEYEDGKLNDKEFFLNFIGNSFGKQEMPSFEIFEKYKKIINYLNNNKILYFIILSTLLVFLYLLVWETKLFLIILGGILFSIGTLILLPYVGILIYDNYVGIDTTPILGSLFGGGDIFNPNVLISILLITFLKIYNSFIIMLGIIFFIIGLIGKVYGVFSERKSKPKKGRKSK